MFKKNAAVTGFKFHLRSATDGSDTTTGTPVGYYTLDGGTQTAIGDVTPVHKGNGEWSVDLTAAEMNGDLVSLIFVLAGSITADFKIKTTEQLVDDIWNEDMTGHTINNTSGKILKGVNEGWISEEGSVNDVSATTTSFITDLTNATTSFYSNAELVFITGSLKGQSRPIITYNGTTKAVTFDEAYSLAPANTDQFIILNGHTHTITEIQAGLATEAKQDLVKAKTDQMVFTKANELDTNTKSINSATVIGDGNATPWDGA